MKIFNSGASLLVLMIVLYTYSLEVEAQSCRPSGKIRGTRPPPGECNQENDSDCCVQGKLYTTYKCSPSVSSNTKATLTLNSFQKGGDGGGPSECDNQYHSDVHQSWHYQLDGIMEEEDHDYQPPCANNIVDASKAVWKALGVPEDNWGDLDITWTYA
ncbi:hypothetical protein LguiA_010371 [Lonicera macranthoides]